MSPKEYDRKLGIRTVGLREWDSSNQYHRYEATPYRALDRLIKSYRFKKDDRVVDFGCGKGRVTFFLHNHCEITMVGIEANDRIYDKALKNKANYRMRANHIEAPIYLKYGLAEHYTVKPEDNCFYFFNPFSHQIFRKVMQNVAHSLAKTPRQAEIILYYPLPKYRRIVTEYGFTMINKIKVPGAEERLEKFLIYRQLPQQPVN